MSCMSGLVDGSRIRALEAVMLKHFARNHVSPCYSRKVRDLDDGTDGLGFGLSRTSLPASLPRVTVNVALPSTAEQSTTEPTRMPIASWASVVPLEVLANPTLHAPTILEQQQQWRQQQRQQHLS